MTVTEQENVLVQQRIDAYKLALANYEDKRQLYKAMRNPKTKRAAETAKLEVREAASNLASRITELFESGYRLATPE